MKKNLFLFIFATIICCPTSGLCADQWKMYTNCNDINALALNGDYIWWATTGGIVKWNRLDGTYDKYTALDFQNDIGYHGFSAVTIDNNGTKWFGMSGVITSFNGTHFTSHDIPGTPNSIAVDHNGLIWIASDAGAVRFDGSTVTKYRYLDGFSNSGANAVVVDANNIKWFGAGGGEGRKGLYSFDGTTWEVYTTENSGLLSDTIKSLVFDDNGVLWIGTGGKGICTFDGSEWRTYTEEDGLVSGSVKVIAIDPDSVKWFGTYRGLSSFNGTNWTTYTTDNSGLLDNVIRTIVADDDGSIWIITGKQGTISTPKNGLTRFDGDAWTTTKLPGIRGNTIYALAVDHNNVKWISTYNDLGLSRFDGSTWTTYTAQDGLLSEYIKVITVDHNNVKWFGSWNGVCSFDGTAWKTYTVDDGLGESHVNAIAVDHDNVKWFGTGWWSDLAGDNSGISSFDGTTWTTYTEDDGLCCDVINAIAVDDSNVKWFCSQYSNTVSTYDGVSWSGFDPGFVVNFNSLAIDHDGIKWLGTERNGLLSFDGKPEKPTAVDAADISPSEVEITGIYPNPFNAQTTVEFSVNTGGFVRLDVYNIIGQKVKELAPKLLDQGIHKMIWDGRDSSGNALSSGMYFIRLQTDKSVATGKTVLVQ